MRFTAPAALLLLLLLPLVASLGRPRRGDGEARQRWAVGLRLLILLCLILSLAGLEAVRAADQLAVVFLLDASDSMSAQARQAAAGWIQGSVEKMGADDRAAVVVFGADALVERSMSASRAFGPVTSRPDSGGTDLAGAIRLGLALYPPEAARRMVILSDGVTTTPGAREAAQLAAASGVQIQSVPFLNDPGPEILVASLEAPARLRSHEAFDLWITVEATQAVAAEVRILANGAPVYDTRQSFRPGSQTFSLPLTAGEPGFYRYEVQIDPEQDGHYQNNTLAAFTFVSGPPQALIVGSGPEGVGESAPLAGALRAAGLGVRSIRPVELPFQAGDLVPYAAVILVNLPARELSARQLEALQSYVRDLGGGLVAVGGPASYGVGGYFRTPLEATLPVDMQIKDERRRPAVTLLFMIDRSGSMAETAGGPAKLELAKEAAIRSVDLLFPNDRVGVIAFDETAAWTVPLTDLSDPAAVKNAIASLRAGGGTDILAGLQAGAAALPQDPGKVKHVILLTDGGADPAGLPELVQRLHDEQGISLSTVGVGPDAAPFLAELARLGGGRYHFTAEASTIPSIFTEETSLATRAYIEEHPFVPQRASASPILAQIETLPPLQGYVVATPKTAAQTVLVSDLGDPLLSVWQYGLGRAAAFTSDAAGRWAQAWIGWSDFPRFWGQLVGAVLRSESPNQRLDIQVAPPGAGGPAEAARLLVDAQDRAGDPVNGFQLAARIVAPDGQAQSLPLQQVAPGRYQGDFKPAQPGAYLLAVSGRPADAGPAEGLSGTAGWVYPYPPEYRLRPPDPQLLEQVTALTGGGLASAQPGEVFRHNLPAPRAARPLWPWLLALAALLLPIDIGVRRLALPPGDARRAWASLLERLKPRTGGPAAAAPPVRRLETLLKAKQRPLHEQPRRGSGSASAPADPAANRMAAPPHESQPSPGASPPADSPKNRENELESPQASTAARLLARKREKNRDRP